MIKVNGYSSYNGGKSGSGTYQTIINRIPPHEVFMSLFLGNCGVTRHIKPATFNILNDIDYQVYTAWQSAVQPSNSYLLLNKNAIAFISESVLKDYDCKETFIFLDPTYLMDTRKSQHAIYRHEMTNIDHELLLGEVLKIKQAMVMICAYPNGLYDEVLQGWNTYDFYSKTRNGMALERLYYNYEVADRLHDYSFIGDTFRVREKNNRIKNNYLAKLKRLDPQLRNSILTDLASHK